MLDDLILRTSYPADEPSAGRGGIYTTDCDTVWGFPRMNSAVADCGAIALMFRSTKLPPDEFSARWNGDYIWRDLWTGPSVCNRSVTGSLPFGPSHRLGRCCLWLAGLPFRLIGSADVPLRHHLLPAVSRRTSHEVDTHFHSHLCPVHPGEGEMDFLPPCFKLILTLSYCLYEFLRDQELGTGRSPDTDKADSFHEQIRWAKLNVFAPDSQDVRELWVVRPHVILVKVIYVCGFHVFFHQYVADIRERKSENIFRTVSTSTLVFNMTVMSSSGVIVSPSDVPIGQIQPLTAVVSSTDADSTVTPFVGPPPPGY